MALSPLDIRNKSFSQKLRGYEREEVDEFLDQVINDYEETIRSKRELEKSLKHAEEKLTYFNELKDALNQSIIVAQDTADKLKESANQESTNIVTSAQNQADRTVAEANEQARTTVEKAKREADQILEDATSKALQLAHETDDLKRKTREFHRSLSYMLESQVQLTKAPEWEDLLRPFSSYMGESHSNVQEALKKDIDNKIEDSVNLNNGETKAIPVVETEATKEIEVDEHDPIQAQDTQIIFPITDK